MGIEKGVNCA